MFLISDNVDTYTGMRLAGVDGVVVHERKELREQLEKVLQDKSIGIVPKNSDGNFRTFWMNSVWREKSLC